MEDDITIQQPLVWPCKISLCPPEETTDFDSLLNNASGSTGMDGGNDQAERFIIEFGTESPVISVAVNQTISIGDIIGYMRGIPVKSQIAGQITAIGNKYIIGVYETDYNKLLSGLDITSEQQETVSNENVQQNEQ